MFLLVKVYFSISKQKSGILQKSVLGGKDNQLTFVFLS